MRLPSLRQLRTFLTVAETGSISASARSLGLTQPAVSQQMRELESILQADLFERVGGKLILTASGEALIPPARRAQAATEDSVTATRDISSGRAGRLRVGSGASACIYFLPEVLAAVKRHMPAVAISVTIGDTAEILPLIEMGAIDIAVLTLPKNISKSLHTHALFDEPLVALLPSSAAFQGDCITAGRLSELPLISYKASGHTQLLTNSWFQDGNGEPNSIMELETFEAIKVMVGAGLGAAVVPKLALPTPVRNTHQISLSPPLSRTVGYIMRHEKALDLGMLRLISEMDHAASLATKAAALTHSRERQ